MRMRGSRSGRFNRGARVAPLGSWAVPISSALSLLGIVVCGACTDTAGPRWIEGVNLGPDSAHLKVGESRVFHVKLYDQEGKEMSDEWLPRVHWSSTRPSVATLEISEEGPVVTAVAPGIAFVRAELGRGQADAPVYVQPPGLDRIEIRPSPLTESLVSRRVVAYAHLFDASGNEMSPQGFRLSWKVADTTIARISNQISALEFAVVQGRQAGHTRLRLIVGDTAVSTDVFVIPEPLAPSAPGVNMLSSSSLEVTWAQDIGGATDGYRVYRSIASSGAYTHIASPGEGKEVLAYRDTTYVDEGLSPNTTYFYVIEACHKEGGCSEPSPPGSGKTLSGE